MASKPTTKAAGMTPVPFHGAGRYEGGDGAALGKRDYAAGSANVVSSKVKTWTGNGGGRKGGGKKGGVYR